MNPGSGDHGSEALRDYAEILLNNAERGPEVAHEFVQVLDELRHAGRCVLDALGPAVRARIPREKRYFRQIQFVHNMRHAARMLMAAVDQDYGAIPSALPMPVEDSHAVMGREGTFPGNPRYGALT